jgi:hypothetical protein
MRENAMKYLRAGLYLLLLAPGAALGAGLPATDPTYRAIAAADAALFGASNRCDLTSMTTLVADDLEFYHDRSGLSLGRADLLQKTKDNLCNKVMRELVPGSLEVHPLPGFGAIELGTHRFRNSAEPGSVGEAKFAHVWRLRDGAWQLYRVLSFDH